MTDHELQAAAERLKGRTFMPGAGCVLNYGEYKQMCEALTAYLGAAAEREKLREVIRYWSYCTYHGMRRHCPEKESEFLSVCRELGIQPYAAGAAAMGRMPGDNRPW